MTASEAREILLNLSWAVGAERRSQIAALVEQQAQEIERLNKSLQFEQNYLSRVGTHADGCYKWGPGHWDCAVQEIERLNRMIKLVLNRVTGDMAECHGTHVCQQDFTGKSQAESDNICIECWNKYLESEVAK